jgi:hypothetical protein
VVESEKGSEKQSVELSMSRVGEAPKGNFDDWISQKVFAFERRLTESDNYLLSFVMDPMQVLAREGLLEGATEVSFNVTDGSLAKLAWGQDLYRRDPVGVLTLVGGGNGGGGGGRKLTVFLDGVICVTIFGKKFCFKFGRHF